MGIKIKFIQDDNAEDIEVIIRAKEQNKDVENILSALGTETDNVLVCNSLTKEELIDINEIIIISKVGRYLSVKTINSEYILNEPLYKIEEKLDKTLFVKISQSEIVNLKYVKRWDFSISGVVKIELAKNLYSYTSRRYASQIKAILKKGGEKNAK